MIELQKIDRNLYLSTYNLKNSIPFTIHYPINPQSKNLPNIRAQSVLIPHHVNKLSTQLPAKK